MSIDPKKLEETASKLRAIAHPVRIAIISLLEKNKEMNVTQIFEKLGTEQAATSHHLNVLKDKGVLESKRVGKNTFYFLKEQALIRIVECLDRCNN